MVKYIVAGYHKTGTKSLSAAFRSLGFRVYDAPEVHLFMRQTWINFLAGKITIEEVAQEYEDQNVDVIIDSPGFFFWKELHKIWPKAKVILTERDSTDVWWKSAKSFFNNLNQWAPCKYGWFFNYLSPTAYSTLVHLTYPMMYMIHGTLKMYVQHADLDNPSVRNIMIETEMKYIVAGYHKTGTKSLSAAFCSLGLRVYDAPEVHLFMRQTWIDFFAGKITIKKVAEEYEVHNVDVIIDSPGFFFWKEFHKIWPNAKVILTERDSTEIWWRSAKRFFDNCNQWAPQKYGRFFNYLSPTAYSTLAHLRNPMMNMIHGTLKMYAQHGNLDNPSVRNIMTARYEAHNAYVKSHADERFLIYNVKQGWAPLCQFMDIPPIDGPIPHHNQSKNKNDTKEFMDDMMTPFVNQCKKEIYITLTAILIGLIGMALAVAFLVKDYA